MGGRAETGVDGLDDAGVGACVYSVDEDDIVLPLALATIGRGAIIDVADGVNEDLR